MAALRRLVTLVALTFAVAVLATTTNQTAGDPRLDSIREIAKQQTVQGACDVDGVDVGYHTAYRSGGPLGYDVPAAVVSNISWPSCSGATLTVVLGDGTTHDRATGGLKLDPSLPQNSGLITTANGNATVTVPERLKSSSSSPAGAEWISEVGVTLDGGTTPVPVECTGMQFANVFVGTTGDDTINGTNPAGDLLYGLTGTDRITSMQGDDCLITGTDAQGDTITAGNGNNVVRTGGGADSISVGNGTNRIYAYGGNDTITVGNGKNNLIDGGDGTDICNVPRSAKNPTFVSCERVNRT